MGLGAIPSDGALLVEDRSKRFRAGQNNYRLVEDFELE